MSSSSAIRILIVEDFHAETEALSLELKEAEMNNEVVVAKTESEYAKQLGVFKPHVILSPYSLKNTNAIKLLVQARESGIDAPFILLAFDLSEDIAIELLGEGVEDYVLRSTIKRLPVAIKKALQRHKTNLELQLSESKLRNTEASLRNMVSNTPMAVAMFDSEMNYLVVSDTWLKHEKKTEKLLIGKNHYTVVPEIPEPWKKVHQDCLKGATRGSDLEKITRADGTIQFIRWKMNPWFDAENRIGGVVLFIEDISKIHSTQQQLKASESSLRLAQQVAKIGNWEVDPATNRVKWSDEMFVIHGIEPQALSVELIRGLTHPEDLPLFDAGFQQLGQGAGTNFVYRIIAPDSGAVKYVHGVGLLEYAPDGSLLRLFGTVQDVTEHQLTSIELKKSQTSLVEAQQVADTGSWEWQMGADEVLMSDQMFSIYEVDRRPMTIDDVRAFVHPEDRPRVAKIVAKDLKKGIQPSLDYRIVTPKGNLKHVVSTAKQVLDRKGRVRGLIGTLQDVSERKKMEEALGDSERILREMAENISEVFYITDWVNKKVLYTSPLYETLYGQPLTELYKDRTSWEKAIHPDDLERLKRNFDKLAPLGKYDEEFRIVLKDGSIKWVRDRAFPIKDEKGVVVRMAGVTEEISAKKESQERIETLSLVAQETVNAVMIQDRTGRILWSNNSFTKISGYKQKDVIGKKPWSFLRGENTNMKLADMAFERIKSGRSFTSENVIYKKDGTPVWIKLGVSPVLDSGGKLSKIVSVGTDISKEKELEELQRNMLTRLESLVQERTSELEEKNFELRKEVWENQRISDELYHNNLDLTDSIQYAKRIQESILPKLPEMSGALADLFVIFLPRDVVSGDFYWHYSTGNLSYFAAIDCTGHGVPGALMSMIANELMNQSVIQKKLSDPAEILTMLNKLMINTLHQKSGMLMMQDGMDVGLCVIDHTTNRVSYSGAMCSMYLHSNGILKQFAGDRHSIGGHLDDVLKSFTVRSFSIKKGDRLYLSTDGYMDQFGGPSGKKLMRKRFENVIRESAELSMKKQRAKLIKFHEEWKGSLNQVDDILLIGLSF